MAETVAPDSLCAKCRALMVEAETKRPTSWELYAMQRADHFEYFYPSTVQLTMCGTDPMFLVRLTLDAQGPYWAWYHSSHPSNRSDKGQISFVYRRRFLVDMCFPYGSDVAAKRSHGEIISAQVRHHPARHPPRGDQV